MKTNDLIDAVGNIGDGYIERYAALDGVKKEKTDRRRFSAKEWIAAAACVALVLGLGFGTFTYAEAAEYKEASKFFEDNGLSKEGLTRAEVRAVYRDITTESFTYSRTAEVIAHDMRTNSIPGWEILYREAPPEVVRDIWETVMERYRSAPHFEVDWTQDERVENGVVYTSAKDSIISKCLGGQKLWTYRTTDMRFYFGYEVSDGVLGTGVIVGDTAIPESRLGSEWPGPTKPAITKLTNEGKLVWFVTWDNGGAAEQQISGVIEEPDGSYTVISQNRDLEHRVFAVCVTRISHDGEYLGSRVNPTEENLWVCDAKPFDGGCVAIGYDNDSLDQCVVWFESDGTLSARNDYSENGRRYRIGGVEVFGGRLYVSAKLIDNGAIMGEDVPAGDVTDLAKETCTAVLLVCEEGGGTPEVFFTVKGAVSRELTVKDGKLIWSIDRIVSAEKLSMFGLAFSGTAERVEFSFNEDGTLEGIVSSSEMNIMVYG